MKTKILVVICVLFMFGCSEKEEVSKKIRPRGKRIKSSSKTIALEKRVGELEAQIEILSHKQARMVKAIDFHSREIYNRVVSIEHYHPGVNDDFLEDWSKEKWVESIWELD
jgi:hypothetical protein